MASLFLSCLGVGWSIGEAIARMMGQIGIPVDTEHTAVWDYRIPLWLGIPAGALLCPIQLWGMMWLHCACGWSADGLGRLSGGFLWVL